MGIESCYSKKKDSISAGKQIGKKLAGSEFGFLFASVKYDFGKLLEGIREESDVTISGTSTSGAICSDKLVEEGVVALGFNDPHIKFGSGVGKISGNPVKAGEISVKNALSVLRKKKEGLMPIFAKCFAASINDPTELVAGKYRPPNTAVTTFIDGLSGVEERVLEGVTKSFSSPLPVIGGSSGDDLKLKKTLQICNNRVYENSVVATLIFTSAPLAFSLSHGWTPRKEICLVTKSKGRIVYELNNRPALDVYAELLNIKADDLLREKQIAFKTGLKHPFGVLTMLGECWLKHPMEVFEDGSISFFSNVYQGTALIATDGDPNVMISTSVDSVKKAIENVGEAGAVLLFNCVARKVLLGKRAAEEVKRISELTDAPIVGMYTYGEQAFTRTTPVAHRNQTLSTMVMGK